MVAAPRSPRGAINRWAQRWLESLAWGDGSSGETTAAAAPQALSDDGNPDEPGVQLEHEGGVNPEADRHGDDVVDRSAG